MVQFIPAWAGNAISVGARGLARMGKTPDDLKAPPVQWREYVDRTTGRVTRYPAGVDPGFAHNPGKAWKDGVKQPVRAPNVAPVGAAPPVLARPGEASVSPATIERFIAKPEGEVQIGTAPSRLMHLLPIRSQTVLLSQETMVKQLEHHRDVPSSLYQQLPALIAAPEVVLDNKPRHLRLLGEIEDQVVAAVLKAVGDAWYVQNFHLLSLKTLRQLLRKAEIRQGSPDRLLEVLKKRAR